MARSWGPRTVAPALVACLLASGLSAAPRPAYPPASQRFLSGYEVGVVLRAESLEPGLARQPTGPALVGLLRARGIRIVRLLAPPGMRGFGPGPWRAVFDTLRGIDVLLTLTGDPAALRTGVVTDPEAYADAEIRQLREIRAQNGGAVPPTLVAVDVINEPVVTRETLPALCEIARRVREAAGLPVTTGGWRTPGGFQGHGVFNAPDPAVVRSLAACVDVLSIHVYPDLQPGADRESADSAAYEPAADRALRVAVEAGGGLPVFVEEFGGGNGLGPSPHGRWGSPSHQRAVIDAVLRAMSAFRDRGVIGGTAWQLAPPPGQDCDAAALLCYDPLRILPALDDLGRAARSP